MAAHPKFGFSDGLICPFGRLLIRTDTGQFLRCLDVSGVKPEIRTPHADEPPYIAKTIAGVA